jgi:hypothetical protein
VQIFINLIDNALKFSAHCRGQVGGHRTPPARLTTAAGGTVHA